MDVEKIFQKAVFFDETNFIEVLRIKLMKNFFTENVEEDDIDDYDVENVIAAKSAEYFEKINNHSI